MLSILSIPALENASAGSPQQSFFYQKVLHLLDNLPSPPPHAVTSCNPS